MYLYFLEEVRNIFIIKRKGATEKSIQDNTTAPHVNFGSSIQLSRYNLGKKKTIKSDKEKSCDISQSDSKQNYN